MHGIFNVLCFDGCFEPIKLLSMILLQIMLILCSAETGILNSSVLWVMDNEEFSLCAKNEPGLQTEILPEGVNVTYELASLSATYGEGNIDLSKRNKA